MGSGSAENRLRTSSQGRPKAGETRNSPLQPLIQLGKDCLPGKGNCSTGVISSDPFPDFQVPRRFHVGRHLRLHAGQDAMRQRKTLAFAEKQYLRGNVFERLHEPRLPRFGHGGASRAGSLHPHKLRQERHWPGTPKPSHSPLIARQTCRSCPRTDPRIRAIVAADVSRRTLLKPRR